MAVIGAGTTFLFETTGFTAVVEDLNLASPSRNDVETTHMGSPTTTSAVGANVQVWQEFMAGAANAGEMSYDIQYDPDAVLPIDEAKEWIKVTHRSGATFRCQGYINNTPITVPVQDKMAATINIKWSGVPTWTPA